MDRNKIKTLKNHPRQLRHTLNDFALMKKGGTGFADRVAPWMAPPSLQGSIHGVSANPVPPFFIKSKVELHDKAMKGDSYEQED